MSSICKAEPPITTNSGAPQLSGCWKDKNHKDDHEGRFGEEPIKWKQEVARAPER